MGQSIADTVDEEGIAYSISYVTSDIVIGILVDKGIGKLADAKKVGNAADVAKVSDEVTSMAGDAGKASDEIFDIAEQIPTGVADNAGPVTLQTGGRQIDYNAYIKRLETIDIEYENIRINTTDVSQIAQNTGMPEWKINRIKEHVFSKEHILDSGVKRFDADPEIADAWYRLTNGNFNKNDIDLLNHEYFESKFESFYKTDYRTAHGKTEESGRIWDPYKEDN